MVLGGFGCRLPRARTGADDQMASWLHQPCAPHVMHMLPTPCVSNPEHTCDSQYGGAEGREWVEWQCPLHPTPMPHFRRLLPLL